MAPTKNLRKNYRVKSKKRPIPKNNKRKTNKSKKRTSRNKRRTRRKQKGGMNTSVIVLKENPRVRFRTRSRKSEIKRKLPTTASPSIQKREGRYIDPFEEYPQNLLLKHMGTRNPRETALYISNGQADPFLKGPGAESTLISRQSSKLPMHSKHLRLIPAGQGATLRQ